MGKHYNVSIDVEMPDGISEEEVGKRIEAALGAQKIKHPNFGEVTIKTIDKLKSAGGVGGYDSRLWEKTTCA